MFSELRMRIMNCDEGCIVPERHSPPLYFNCISPGEVKILVISEQPKETNVAGIMTITEETIKQCLRNELDASPTITKIAGLFSERYKDSILRAKGAYYWSHHTKCPSATTCSTQANCPQRWLISEIKVFPNLKCIICIGRKAHYAVLRCANAKRKTITDMINDEIKLIESTDSLAPRLSIGDRDVYYIALSHVSTTPLRRKIEKIKPIISRMENYVLALSSN